MLKIVFAGGGSGGHIYPILSVAQSLRQLHAEKIDLLYLVRKDQLEHKLALEADLRVSTFPDMQGMPRSWRVLPWLVRLLYIAFCVGYRMLRSERPDLIFSTGGYASAPVLLAALVLRIPYVLHNLDSHVGLCNQVFMRYARALSMGMKPQRSLSLLDGPVIISGNPVREEFHQDLDRLQACAELDLNPQRKILLVTGGSQGSRIINESLRAIIPQLLSDDWQILHQIGNSYTSDELEDITSYSKKYHPLYKVQQFIPAIWKGYSACDLYIGRAGAMTLAEISFKAVASIIIPIPHLAQNHQMLNAQSLAENGSIHLLGQDNLSPDTLLKAIKQAYNERHLLKINLSTFSKINSQSAQNIANLLNQIMS